MSYILDALKKAEQERDLGRVPRIETVHDNTPRRARVLPWLIAGILLVNVVALIWWLRPATHSDVAMAVRQAPMPVAPPVPIAPVRPASPAAPPVNRMPSPVVVAPPVAAAPVVQAAPRAPVKTPVAPVVSAPIVAKPTADKAPLLRDLPADFRAEVPSLSLDVHVYAPAAKDRFVLINMKKYREGDQLAEGPRIAEITEDGVVLNYRGRVFRIARP